MAKIPGVFIVDQDPDARFQAAQVVRQVEFSASGEAGLGTEAVALATEQRPDIVLVGIKEPAARVLQTIESLVHALPQTPVIAYAVSEDVEMMRRAMLAGARDFLQAPFGAQELRRSLVAALESEERRRLREAGTSVLGAQAITIAVFGAKGGIGKTTVATNLGVAMARAGQSTVVVDLDDTFGDAASALALSPKQTATEAIREATRVSPNGSSEPVSNAFARHESGLDVLAAPANPLDWNDISGDGVQQLLRQLGRKFDVVIADTASSVGERTLAILSEASIVLWLTTPDYSSVRDSLQAMQAISSLDMIPPDRIRLALNVSSSELDVRPGSIEEALAMPIFWTIPFEPRLRRSGQLGQAFVDSHAGSDWASSVTDLGRVLSGRQPSPAPRSRSLGKLFGGLKIRLPKGASLPAREEARP